MKKTADDWFEAYGASHKNPTNKNIHWVCIPLIVMSLIGLLWGVALEVSPWANLGVALVVGSVLYYLTLSVQLAFGMLVITGGLIGGVLGLQALESSFGVPLWGSSLAIFVLAWVGQFVGHKIEGKKPSFFEDLQFLMIGPLWLLGHIYRKLNIRY